MFWNIGSIDDKRFIDQQTIIQLNSLYVIL